jgi:C-terminal AAA-associated domain
VQEGDAILSTEGHAFVEAPVPARKELFRAALQPRPTLVSLVHAALAGKANRRLSESFFLGLQPSQPIRALRGRNQLLVLTPPSAKLLPVPEQQ